MKHFLILAFFFALAGNSFACKLEEKVNQPFVYLAPCVTDLCIRTYLTSPVSYQKRHCLASININGQKDWGYVLGKKCRELIPYQKYTAKTKPTRCYKNSIPRRLFTSDYKVSSEEKRELKAFFEKNVNEPYTQDEVHLHLMPFGKCMADIVHSHKAAPRDHQHHVTGPLCK